MHSRFGKINSSLHPVDTQKCAQTTSKLTISDLQLVALNQDQNYSSGVTYFSVGVSLFPLVSFVPEARVLPHLTHLLPRSGNNVCSNFNNFISIRIEKKSNEEIEA